jgi:hypothetical protein
MFYSKILDKDKSLDFETHHKYILGDHIVDHIVKVWRKNLLEVWSPFQLGIVKGVLEVDDLAKDVH